MILVCPANHKLTHTQPHVDAGQVDGGQMFSPAVYCTVVGPY